MIMKMKDGREVEAISLLMTKGNALDILSGKKKVEVRALSNYYINLFKGEKGTEEELMRDIFALHFTNYNKTWFLDVEVTDNGWCILGRDAILDLNEQFDFHDFDADVEKIESMPDKEKPGVFWFELGEVIATDLKLEDDAGLPRVTTKLNL